MEQEHHRRETNIYTADEKSAIAYLLNSREHFPPGVCRDIIVRWVVPTDIFTKPAYCKECGHEVERVKRVPAPTIYEDGNPSRWARWTLDKNGEPREVVS